MSFEGFYEILCPNGHYSVAGCWDMPENDVFVCRCGAKGASFVHLVDETNCEGERYPFEVVSEAVIEFCNLGHAHITRDEVYKIPEKV